MRRFIVATVLAAALLGSAVAGAAVTSRFTDVPVDHWSAPYVEWAVDNGIIPAKDDGTFRPDEVVTRAQLAYALLKYDQMAQPLTMSETSAIVSIIHGYSYEWENLEIGEALPRMSDGFHDAYRWVDVYRMFKSLCHALDKAEEGSAQDYFRTIPTWLAGQDWKPGVTYEDRWRVILHGIFDLCADHHASALDWWMDNGDFEGLEGLIDGTDTHPTYTGR